jgi:hypothetical protein
LQSDPGGAQQEQHEHARITTPPDETRHAPKDLHRNRETTIMTKKDVIIISRVGHVKTRDFSRPGAGTRS